MMTYTYCLNVWNILLNISQELIYERPYMVLPPLMEWVRVSSAFAEHRMASYVDSDDTLQAGRIVRYDLLYILCMDMI